MIIYPAAALTLLNTTHLGKPSVPDPWPTQSIICYDSRYAQYPPAYPECERIITDNIATGTNPATPIPFSRSPLPGIHSRVPKAWIRPRGTCRVSIDVPDAAAEEASLVEIQATARAILMSCVLGADHLGGMTLIGRTGNMLVEILGFLPGQRNTG